VLTTSLATAQTAPKLKVGLMLPASGTYAALGTAIENGFKLYVAEQGGKLAGREIEFAQVDDESDPAKAIDNVGSDSPVFCDRHRGSERQRDGE
jgi:branched-chain amino acid transport system substrate-binding protein